MQTDVLRTYSHDRVHPMGRSRQRKLVITRTIENDCIRKRALMLTSPQRPNPTESISPHIPYGVITAGERARLADCLGECPASVSFIQLDEEMLSGFPAFGNITLATGTELARSHPERIRRWAQDVLNVLLESRWLLFNWRFHALLHLWKHPENADASTPLGRQAGSIRGTPAMVHFAGSGAARPWRQCDLEIRQQTPWATASGHGASGSAVRASGCTASAGPSKP